MAFPIASRRSVSFPRGTSVTYVTWDVELAQIQSQLDLIYLDLAKGAFIRSRAKWLEEGEKNTSNFFALEKRFPKSPSNYQNFSPHTSFICSNGNITVSNKSLI